LPSLLSAPPHRNRTGPISGITASHLGCVTAKAFFRYGLPYMPLPSACDTLTRLCVRRVLCWARIPLGLLPFAPPAPRRVEDPLCFVLRLPRLPDADRRPLPNGRIAKISRFPRQGASAHARFFDHAGSFGPCDWVRPKRVAFRTRNGVGNPGIGFYRGRNGHWLTTPPRHRSEHALLNATRLLPRVCGRRTA